MLSPSDNKEILRRVAAGDRIQAIADTYHITTKWVYRLANDAGVKIPEHPPVLTGRDQYLGVNVRKPVKAALKRRAKEQGKSVSHVTDETLAEGLGVTEEKAS